ncbi:TIGR01777 family oxidoreductase [Aureitalea sp. L0-47]|uniref:TIGR01777 family oxidoreductase n=1 Tax=Aureitalea sp. L0-47 TaxID=2816962 RepID=UPI0022384620|nr:TIGR01777 family oxidoreductase [Aureitalea sp. L0-47]MCW5519238.1 TIGR01777 family oxidoreductase [Aureitalea sp. L0-47]
MKVLITGATGLIGSQLSKAFQSEGHTVHYLTTRKNAIVSEENYKGFYWNPSNNELDPAAMEGVSAIIHLAGATVSKRWTKAYKEEIIDSRLKSADLLYSFLKNNPNNVEHFISASGVGLYPSNDEIHSEETTKTDDGFLAEVVKAWEVAAHKFEDLGIKVSVVRTGIVLSTEGGALKEMSAPIRKGVGAPLGKGTQWQSWIHIGDMVQLYLDMTKKGWEGVYNAVAPNPVTNKELTHQIAKTLGKRIWLPNVPSFVLRIILGEMADIVLDGQRASSKKLETKGFNFNFPHLDGALQDLL